LGQVFRTFKWMEQIAFYSKSIKFSSSSRLDFTPSDLSFFFSSELISQNPQMFLFDKMCIFIREGSSYIGLAELAGISYRIWSLSTRRPVDSPTTRSAWIATAKIDSIAVHSYTNKFIRKLWLLQLYNKTDYINTFIFVLIADISKVNVINLISSYC